MASFKNTPISVLNRGNSRQNGGCSGWQIEPPIGNLTFPSGIWIIPVGMAAIPGGKVTIPAGKMSRRIGKMIFPAGKQAVPTGRISAPLVTEGIPIGRERFHAESIASPAAQPSNFVPQSKTQGGSGDPKFPVCRRRFFVA